MNRPRCCEMPIRLQAQGEEAGGTSGDLTENPELKLFYEDVKQIKELMSIIKRNARLMEQKHSNMLAAVPASRGSTSGVVHMAQCDE